MLSLSSLLLLAFTKHSLSAKYFAHTISLNLHNSYIPFPGLSHHGLAIAQSQIAREWLSGVLNQKSHTRSQVLNQCNKLTKKSKCSQRSLRTSSVYTKLQPLMATGLQGSRAVLSLSHPPDSLSRHTQCPLSPPSLPSQFFIASVLLCSRERGTLLPLWCLS